MNDENSAQDLKDRLKTIESMIAEGRRSTGYWGWSFVLWGVAFYVAMGWTAWDRSAWAWPVTMVAAGVVTWIVASTTAKGRAETTLGRAIGSIWCAAGISMFIVLFSLGFSGKLTAPQLFIAVASGMLGMTNAASAFALRWKVQLGVAVIWWAAAVAACFATVKQALAIFIVATFIGQIAFGVYGMVREGGAKRQQGAAHA
jgi:hypothetical protein